MFSTLSKDKNNGVLDFNDAISQEEADILRDETVIGKKSNRSLDELLISITALVTEVEEMKQKEEERGKEKEGDALEISQDLIDCLVRQFNSTINLMAAIGAPLEDNARQLATFRDEVVRALGSQPLDRDVELANKLAGQLGIGNFEKVLNIIKDHRMTQ